MDLKSPQCVRGNIVIYLRYKAVKRPRTLALPIHSGKERKRKISDTFDHETIKENKFNRIQER